MNLIFTLLEKFDFLNRKIDEIYTTDDLIIYLNFIILYSVLWVIGGKYSKLLYNHNYKYNIFIHNYLYIKILFILIMIKKNNSFLKDILMKSLKCYLENF